MHSVLQSPIGSETQKNSEAQKKKVEAMFSATKGQEDPLAEPYQKLRDSPAPAPTACVVLFLLDFDLRC